MQWQQDVYIHYSDITCGLALKLYDSVTMNICCCIHVLAFFSLSSFMEGRHLDVHLTLSSLRLVSGS